jgi:hypothetical protein
MNYVMQYLRQPDKVRVGAAPQRMLQRIKKRSGLILLLMDTFAKFDATDYLDSEEMIAEYLTAALEDENPDVFLAAIADVAKARGMSAIEG